MNNHCQNALTLGLSPSVTVRVYTLWFLLAIIFAIGELIASVVIASYTAMLTGTDIALLLQ